MIELRRSEERGHGNHGWLDSYHSFSFADYYNPREMGFGPLRVINEDYIAPGTGFGMHSHRDMEILTLVLAGELAHQDSIGNSSVIRAGDVQCMSAGCGVKHSEVNHADGCETHLLQIWIEPAARGIPPSYDEKHFDETGKRGRLCLIASPDGRDGSVLLHQDASIYAGLFDGDETASHSLAAGRRAYLHVAQGVIVANGETLRAGDALKVVAEPAISLAQGRQAEVLLFDLP
jgi:redox-sensitive bicupin YhaK (pirin superfamily)